MESTSKSLKLPSILEPSLGVRSHRPDGTRKEFNESWRQQTTFLARSFFGKKRSEAFTICPFSYWRPDEKLLIIETLNHNGGNRDRTAAMLDIGARTLI